MLVLMGLGNVPARGINVDGGGDVQSTDWTRAQMRPRAVDCYGCNAGRWYYQDLPRYTGNYVYTYNHQRDNAPPTDPASLPLRVFPITGLGAEPTAPTVASNVPADRPNYRLRIRFSGTSSSVPITADEQREAAADLERGSAGKLRVFYGESSPILTAAMPRGYHEGDPLVFWYEVDVWLASGTDLKKAIASIERIIEEKRRFFSAGLAVVDAVFEAIAETAGKAVGSLLKHLWPVLLIAGGGLAVYAYARSRPARRAPADAD